MNENERLEGQEQDGAEEGAEEDKELSCRLGLRRSICYHSMTQSDKRKGPPRMDRASFRLGLSKNVFD